MCCSHKRGKFLLFVTSSVITKALLGQECLLPCEIKPCDMQNITDVLNIRGFSK